MDLALVRPTFAYIGAASTLFLLQKLAPFSAKNVAEFVPGGTRVCGIDVEYDFTSIGEFSAPNSRFSKSYGHLKLTP